MHEQLILGEGEKIMPKLSVIVPLYNNEKYIMKCIRSIQEQSYRDIQIIIVDDGSTDNGGEICRALSKEDNRIEIVHQENKGLIEARYTGLLHCKTEYATFVDADDFILEDSYIFALNAIERNVDLVLFEINRYYSEQYIKREKSSVSSGYYDKKRIEREIFPHLFWGIKEQQSGIECSQCVRIVKTHLLLEQHKKARKYNFYFGEDAAVSYPLFLCIKDMEVIDKSYYMHRQREKKCPPYVANENYFQKVFELYTFLKKEFSKQSEEYNFMQQLDYYYMYMVNNRKMKYNDDSKMKYNFLFPFNILPQNKVLLLYGAGSVGKDYYDQIMEYNFCKEVIWVDKNAEGINDKRVYPISYINNMQFDYVMIANSNANICKEIKEDLILMGIKKEIIYSTASIKKGDS